MPGETILTVLRKAAEFLQEKGVDEARPSAEIMLAHVLGCRRLDLYLRFDQPLKEAELEAFRSCTRRRLKGEPVQYITGEMEFYGLAFAVTPAVLSPRPEAEHLVEETILELKRIAVSDSPARALDIGAGSGAIAVAVAMHAENARFVAVDISEEALRVARANAERHGVAERIDFLRIDILSTEAALIAGPFDIIVSNPPYIPDGEIETLQSEVRDFEPRPATSGGADGLRFYRRIAELSPALLAPGGTMLLEIGFGQAEAVCAIFTAGGFTHEKTVMDYSGIQRVMVFRRKVF
jgi:release factor glutamine methyltransferase